jgi:hypothetical protein
MTLAAERYISDLSSRLHVSSRTRLRIETEVRDHINDAIAQRLAAGATSDAAEEQAVAEFGAASELATQFNVITGTQAMRRAPLIFLAAGVAVFGGFLLAAATQPQASTRTNAPVAAQVAFFAAVLAFQIAFVAGVCAASRAAALWRSRDVRAVDRSFVRRCTAIGVGALAVAATGWATAVGFSLDRLTHTNTLTLAIGLAAMISAAIAGGVFVTALRVNAADEWVVNDSDEQWAGVLGFGERAMETVRHYPLVACGVVAAISATSAMAHAETTFTGALPWGIAQVVAVIGAFVLLGPALQLRHNDIA